jgi:hypothetical protein
MSLAHPIRVVNVKGLRTPEQRATVVYCGRAFAGWPQGRFHNPYSKFKYTDPLGMFQEMIERLKREDPEKLEEALRELWEATGRGEKPLGCWCINAVAGDGSEVVCHAQLVAELLRERFGGE